MTGRGGVAGEDVEPSMRGKRRALTARAIRRRDALGEAVWPFYRGALPRQTWRARCGFVYGLGVVVVGEDPRGALRDRGRSFTRLALGHEEVKRGPKSLRTLRRLEEARRRAAELER